MHYFLGGLAVLILFMALPSKTLFAIGVFTVISTLIIKVSASIITQEKIPYTKAIKAVIYSFLALAVTLIIIIASGGRGIIIAPILLWLMQSYAYSNAINITFLASAIISVIVMAGGILTMIAFKLSMTTIF